MCSRHHLGPLHWDSNIKAQQHICLTALNTTKTSSVSSNCDPAYPSYYFHHTEPLWKVLEILWHREHTVHNIKLFKLLKISNCFAKQKTTYNHNYITLKWKHCHLNSIVVTSCNTLGTCKPASTPLLEGPTSKRHDVQVLELDHKFMNHESIWIWTRLHKEQVFDLHTETA